MIALTAALHDGSFWLYCIILFLALYGFGIFYYWYRKALKRIEHDLPVDLSVVFVDMILILIGIIVDGFFEVEARWFRHYDQDLYHIFLASGIWSFKKVMLGYGLFRLVFHMGLRFHDKKRRWWQALNRVRPIICPEKMRWFLNPQGYHGPMRNGPNDPGDNHGRANRIRTKESNPAYGQGIQSAGLRSRGKPAE